METLLILLIILCSIMPIAVVFTFLIFGAKEPIIVISDECVFISGMYSRKIPLLSIENVDFISKPPMIMYRANGFKFGQVRRGKFKTFGSGKAFFFTQRFDTPAVYIQVKNDIDVYINMKNVVDTKNIYKSIKQKIQN